MENVNLKQGDKIALEITGLGVEGEGVGRFGGCVVFVPYAITGDKIEARVTYRKKNFVKAAVTKILTPSPYRVKPVCNRFERCGGCALLGFSYPGQLIEKTKLMIETLRRGAGYEGEIEAPVPSEPLGYRNKLQLPFGTVNGEVALGFYRAGTHKIVSTARCDLNGAWAEKLIAILKDWANRHALSAYSDETKSGILRHAAARYLDGKLQLTVVINGERLPFQNDLLKAVRAEFTESDLYYNVNREDTNVILGKKLVAVDVKPLSFRISGVETELSPFSFLQVNDEIRDKLYQRILEEVKTTREGRKTVVVDAYAGIGILGAALAKRGAEVFNVEIIPEATADADRLKEKNGVREAVTNLTGDAGAILPELLPKLVRENPNADLTVILDPPRKGCAESVLNALNRAEVSALRVLYVSCNYATLARDLKFLGERFEVVSVTPFDMFPETPHIETLVVLRGKTES